jgi:PKD repeat protein
MNMRTDIWKGIAAMGLLLLMGMSVKAQCTLEADIFSDTIACNGNLGGIGPQMSGGSGDFSFQWDPAASVSDPTVQYPMLTASFSQWITVTVTDNVTGCTASDSLYFYPNIQTNATVELCSGSAELTLDPGSMVYSWTAEDPDGNPIDMSAVTGNSFTATELGTYEVMTYYSGCNQVVHEFEVVECSSECPHQITYFSIEGECSIQHCFEVGSGFNLYMWQLNDEPIQFTQAICSSSLSAGEHVVSLTTETIECSYSSSLTFVIEDSQLSVNLDSDTIACNGNLGGIGLQVTGGSGDYSFQWDPAATVSDPTVQYPMITASFPQWITVSVTDNETGCTASDSLYFYPNIQTNATVELCSGSAELTLDPGSMVYNWTAEDPDGNPIDMSGVTGNSFTATELGTYEVMTYYSGCNQVVHEFEVVECGTSCSSTFTYNQECLSAACFAATGTPAIVSYTWDFGDGTPSNFEAEPCHYYAAPGTHDVTLIAIHDNGCQSTFITQIDIDYNSPGSLQLSVEDTVYTCSGVCAGTATAIATGGTPPYTYFWPTNAFTIAMNTSLCAGIGTVEVWDANGCMGSADVVVMEHPVQEFSIADSSSSFIMMNDVGYGICLWATPGFSPYVWSNGSMGQFICISHTPSSPMQDWLAYVMATDSLGCSYLDSFLFEFPFWGDDVWPGDVSYDGVANNTDMLYLGLSFGYSDFERPQASLDWTGQPSLDWNMFISGVNANPKHADTDGNGVVNFADTIAISQNYGQTHGKTENALAGSYPALWVEAVQDTVAPGQGIHATVHLGSASQPVDSLHGIAFTLTFNDMLVDDAAFSIDFSGNALGTVGSDVMTLQKLFLPDGEVDVAVTRTTRQNWGGYGPLATFHIVTTDNLSGIHELRIGVSGITAITAREFPVELASVPDTVIIDPDHVGIGEAFGSSLRVWPNPGSGIFRIEGLHGAELVEVMDATGRSISRRATNDPDALSIDLSEQPDGLYLLRLTGRDGVAVRRLVKTR